MSAPGPDDHSSPLDKPFARYSALGIFCAVVVLLGYIHRDDMMGVIRNHFDDLFPPPAPAVDPNDPVALCLAERAPGIEDMRADGTIDAKERSAVLEAAADHGLRADSPGLELLESWLDERPHRDVLATWGETSASATPATTRVR